MTTNYFQLSNSDKNRFVNIMKLFFGIACILIGIYWVFYEVNTSVNGGSAWITILFLLGFGFYEIWSGLGKAERYIEIGKTFVRLKKTIFLPVRYFEATEICSIEIFSFKISFFLKKGTKVTLRVGTTYIEVNEKIVDALVLFAEQNSINLELKE